MLRFFKWLISLLLIAAVVAAVGIFSILYYYGLDLPDYKQLAVYKPPIVTRLYAGTGQVFAEYAYEKRIYVPLTAIPPLVKHAFLSAEDKNFYHHYGVDFLSIISASLKNLSQLGTSKRPKGASTITQQVAKNFLLADISNSVSYERKIKEAILSFRIENTYSKDYIFELYLNAVYLGAGSYGVAAAALTYFNKSLDELTADEAAFLAALPKAPSRYNMANNKGQTVGRRNWVLGRMCEDGYITTAQYDQALHRVINLSERSTRATVNANYFAEEVRRDLIKRFGEKALYQDGYVVRTTLDPELQLIAEKVLRQGLIDFDKARGWRGPLMHLNDVTSHSIIQDNTVWIKALRGVKKYQNLKPWQTAVVIKVTSNDVTIGLDDGSQGVINFNELRWTKNAGDNADNFSPFSILKIGDVILAELISKNSNQYRLCQIPIISGAIVAIEPQTGRVLAMQGGFDFNLSQFNRATQAQRQSGSAFKPFVCLAALEAGLMPNTIVYDEPFAINMGFNLGVYRPHNWDDKFRGPITLRRSFELSRNVATIRLVYEKVGMKKVSQIAKRFNINANMPYQLSSILGASETTVLQLTSAYAMIANGGKQIAPRFFDHIQDRYGKTVLVNAHFECENCSQPDINKLPYLRDLRAEITDPVFTYQLTSILIGAVQRGTATLLKDLKYPVAVKSGTTNDFKDAWMVGYSPDLAVGIYIGYDQPKSLGNKKFGSAVAGPLFKSFMEQALPHRLIHDFDIPENVEFVPVNMDTGQITSQNDGNMIWEVFRSKENKGIDSQTPPDENFDDGNVPAVVDPWKAVIQDTSSVDHMKNSNAPVNEGEPIESSTELQGIY